MAEEREELDDLTSEEEEEEDYGSSSSSSNNNKSERHARNEASGALAASEPNKDDSHSQKKGFRRLVRGDSASVRHHNVSRDTGTSSKAQGDEETAAVVAADLEHHDNRTSCDEKQCLPQSPPIVDETAKAWSSEKKPQRDSIDDLVDELQTLQVSNEVLLTEEERPKQIPSFRRIRKASQVDNESVKTTTTRSDAKAGDSNSSISEQAQNADANSLANALEKMGLSSTDKPCSSGETLSNDVAKAAPVRQPSSSRGSAQAANIRKVLEDLATLSKTDLDWCLKHKRSSKVLRVPHDISQGLFSHQKSGIEWMWNLWVLKKGGILGDDMGLGKTRTCIAFLSGLFASKLISRVLVVLPKTLISHWKKELSCLGLSRAVYVYHGTANSREEDLESVKCNGGILLTTYGMIQSSAYSLGATKADSMWHDFQDEDAFIWDAVLLDEGHTIKNPKTIVASELRKLPSRQRYLISGTPVQNNLQELWALFDYVQPGLLGDRYTFRRDFEKVITSGQAKDATERQKYTAEVTTKRLRNIYRPYFLRREKRDVFSSSDAPSQAKDTKPTDGESKDSPTILYAKKFDLIVWLELTQHQKRMYRAFLQSSRVRDALNQTKSPLSAITVLKTICNHTMLLSEKANAEVASIFANSLRVEGSEGTCSEAAASCKVKFLLNLLQDLNANGHRTLVFSQSRKFLDLIEPPLRAMGLKWKRIDGNVTSAGERQSIVNDFQSDSTIPLCLLTTQVGGLGLTLTAADRVVILDPAWNPSIDNQAVDRSYRIGQTRDVVVYRLITSGTVEEKIYRNQVFKGVLSKSVTNDEDVVRYFRKGELKEIFSVGNFEKSETAVILNGYQQPGSFPDLQSHMDLICDRTVGVSSHSAGSNRAKCDRDYKENMSSSSRPDRHHHHASKGSEAPSHHRPKPRPLLDFQALLSDFKHGM